MVKIKFSVANLQVLSRLAKVLMFVNSVKKDGSKITLGKQPARNVLRDFFAL